MEFFNSEKKTNLSENVSFFIIKGSRNKFIIQPVSRIFVFDPMYVDF